ncbi:hypothetical protein [Lewinella sp. IMCC34183]|uniref:hypothetical protein n=1 Tax=Lewinella sp. IMCC34183 TaxID=2248762 RepID=UPI0013005F8E|nr:hypothetical protein [Lewinella sp. IMCC34183]
MYTYLIFPAPQDQALLRWFEASCAHSIHTPRVIFEYGSGAIGSDCLAEDF